MTIVDLLGRVLLAAVACAAVWPVRAEQSRAKHEVDHAEIWAAWQKAGHTHAWRRYPMLAIPLLDEAAAPVIDGNVAVREWAAASLTSHTFLQGTGVAAREKFEFSILYTAEALYMAFRSHRPAGALTPGRRDFFEVIFDHDHDHGRYLNAGFRLDGIAWDGVGPAVNRQAWSPHWTYHARVTDFGWEGEIRLPWADVPGGMPKAGTLWGADIARNENTPSDRIGQWCWRSDWHRTKDLGHFLFSGRPVAYRIDDCGWLPERRRMGIRCLVVNAGDTPVRMWAKLALRAAPDALTMSFLRAVDSALAEDLNAAISSTATREEAAALATYAKVAGEDVEQVVPPHQARRITLLRPGTPGDYLVSAAFLDRPDATQPMNALAVPFAVRPVLDIELHSRLYSAGVLAYRVDLQGVPAIPAGAKLTLTVADVTDGAALDTDEITGLTGRQAVDGAFHLQPDPAGMDLEVRADLTADGTSLRRHRVPFVLPPKPAWVHNDIGRSAFVPPPWTPLRADARQTETLMTTYRWTGSDLFPAVTVNGRHPLARPMTLTFRDETGAVQRPKLRAFRLEKQDPETAVYTCTADIPHVGALAGRITVEFDGLAWYALTLTPTAAFQAATFAAALKEEDARLLTVGRTHARAIGRTHVPEAGYAGRFKEMETSFSYHVFLGGFDAGLQWFAERPLDWCNRDLKRVIALQAEPGVHRLDVRLADRPVAVGAPLHWQFGFIPTPARRPAAGYDQSVFMQVNGVPKWRYGSASQERPPVPRLDQRNCRALILFGGWNDAWGYPGIFNKEKIARLRPLARTVHEQGSKVLIFAGWGMSTHTPEWRQWRSELVQLPLKNCGWGSYWPNPLTLHPDLYLYRLKESIETYGVDGVYMDSTTGPEWSINDGMRWTDADGNRRGGYALRAMRDFTKRVYKVLHGEVIDNGIYYNHHSPQADVMVENFTDVRCPSEFAQQYDGPLDAEFIDYFMAKNGGLQYGYYSELTNKDWVKRIRKRIVQLMPVTVPLGIGFKCTNVTFKPFIRRDSYALGAQPMVAVSRAKAWIDTRTAQYLPWWRNAAWISTVPAADVVTALWLQPARGAALLCVSNLAAEPRTIAARLTVNRLGFTPATAADAITGAVYPIRDGAISLDIESERFRLIRLRKQQGAP